MNTTTQPGVASQQTDPDVKNDEIPVETRSPRDIALESMGERQEAFRQEAIAEGLAEDAGAAAMHNRLIQQQEESRREAEAEGLIEKIQEEVAEPMHEAETQVREDLPKNLRKDPLADFIVMDGDEPLFVTKINGENMLIPLEDAKRRLQIRVAAEVDMKNAREYKKSLDAREQALSASEQALRARATAQPVQQKAPTPVAEFSEEDIAEEAKAFVGSAFSDDEETAARRLTKLLMKARAPTQAPQPVAAPIDFDGLVKQAAAAAKNELRADDEKQDLIMGIEAFQEQYQDIVGDVRLYSMADGMTDDIAAEHPTWKKSQVMLEAGKRTREWVESLKGTGTTDVEDEDDPVTIEDKTPPNASQSPKTQDRHVRKQGLVRLPRAGSGAAPKPSQGGEARLQTAAEALAETRAARGQPT